LLVKVIEEEFEDGIEFIDHLCYATQVDRVVFRRCVVVALAATLRSQIRKIVDALLGSIFVVARLLLPNYCVEWVEIK